LYRLDKKLNKLEWFDIEVRENLKDAKSKKKKK